MKGENQHYHSLDGLRGLAALVVVCLHYVSAFAPALIGYVVTTHHTRIIKVIAGSPLQLPFAGDFAVCIFFVLSGFVLSLNFFKHKSVDVLIKGASRRYFRLMLPALGSIMIGYLLLRSGAIHTQQAAAVAPSPDWLSSVWTFPAHITQALYQGVYGVFFTGYKTYNNVLWTMQFELFGSFLVFGFLALFGALTKRWVFYAVLSLMFIKSYFLGFVLGVAIADVWLNYPKIKDALSTKIVWIALPVGLILGSWSTASVYPNLYTKIQVPSFSPLQLAILAHVLGAAIVIVAVLKLRVLAQVLERSVFQYLGRISFSVYLLHLLVLGSFASALFAWLAPHIGHVRSLLIIFPPSLAITIGAAHLYTRYVDVPATEFSRQAGAYLISEKPLSLKPLRKFVTKLKRKILSVEPEASKESSAS